MTNFYKLSLLFVLTLISMGTWAQNPVYVNHAATGNNDGSTWADAYTDLQAAINATTTGEIWVATGKYLPTNNPADRDATFQLKNDVAIYGGFAGGENDRSQRNWETNVTVLSGDIDGDDLVDIITDPINQINGNNSHAVVTVSGVNNTAILDGVTITAGRSGSTLGGAGIFSDGGSPTLTNLDITGNWADANGGAMHNRGASSPIISNTKIRHNRADGTYAGGIYNFGSGVKPTLTNVEIYNNQGGNGGGMHNRSSASPTLTNVRIIGNTATSGGGIGNTTGASPILTNVTISGNNATTGSGGGIHNNSSLPTLTNVAITGNVSGASGGGIYTIAGDLNPVLTNCIISGNYAATNAGAVFQGNTSGVWSRVILRNTIVWGNSSPIDPSVRNDIASGSNNLIEAPSNPEWTTQINSNIPGDHSSLAVTDIFVNPIAATATTPTFDGDYKLKENSPAINAGDNVLYTDAGGNLADDLDLAGGNRLVGDDIDLGAYEYQGTTTPAGDIIFVNHAATGSNNGSSWTDAYTDLQTALSTAIAGKQIWVAAGTYLPTENLGTTTADRDKAFLLREGVKVYGGFAGNEDPASFDLNTRDFVNNETILSGDIDGTPDVVNTDSDGTVTGITGNTGNTYHVVVSYNNSIATVLDGFTIEGGNADPTGESETGSVEPEAGFDIARNNGGGIYIRRSSPTLTNLIVRNNAALDHGAGLRLQGGKENTTGTPTEQLTISHSTIRNNHGTTVAADFSGSRGGAFSLVGETDHLFPMLMSDVIVDGNLAAVGGATRIEVNTDPTFSKVTFSNNKARRAGAIYISGEGSKAKITDSFFEKNKVTETTTSGSGGAIQANTSSTLEVNNTLFSGNETAGGYGGAIYKTSTGAKILVTNSTFIGNTSSAGGAIYATGNNTNGRNLIQNSVFYNNSSTALGGALTFGGSPTDIINSVFYNNKAATSSAGGAIRITNSTANIINLYNSILYGNTGTGTYPEFSIAGGSLTIKNTITQTYGANGVDGVQVGIDPQFLSTDPVNEDNFLRLSATSPAVDAGENSLYISDDIATDKDLAGNDRVYDYANGGVIDLGAYEYQPAPVPAGDIIFVKVDAAGGNNGSSWTDAHTDLQTALSTAVAGKQIWVARGVYKPVSPINPTSVTDTEREATFTLINGVEIYGGFAGNEDPATFDLKDRDFETNETILSGDIDSADPNGKDDVTVITAPATQIKGRNSYNVVTASSVDNTAVLDGFTVTGGLADRTTADLSDRFGSGGGIFNSGGSPVLANLNITGNKTNRRGGGMFNTGGGATPAMTHIRITNNETGHRGGGMANQNNSSPKLNYAVISGNKVTGWGGGIFNWNSTTHLTNAQITGNVAVDGTSTGQGGALNNNNSGRPVLTNVVISGNYAQSDGGAIYTSHANARPILINSIVWGNGTEGNNPSIFDDIHESSNNLIYIATQTIANNNPQQVGSNIIAVPNPYPSTILAEEIFEAPVAPSTTPTTDGDYSLKAGSVAINGGDNAKYTAADKDPADALDLAGLPRLVSTNIDLGPYEYQGITIPAGDIIYVNHAATGNNNGTSWTDAFTSLQAAINSASAGDEIWVAKGTYLPTDNLQGTTTDRDKTFTLREGVKVYGGFAGSELADFDRSTRNFETNETILSGDFDGNDAVFTDVNSTVESINGNEENAYHVVMSWNNSPATVLDGFTIKGGNANQTGAAHTPEAGFSFNRSQGGGIYTNSSSPTLHNLVVEHNYATATGSNPGAAGIYLNGGKDNYDISLFNVSVKENLAVARGAGLYITGAGTSIVVEDSRFIGNKSTTQLGGGLYVANGTVSIARSEFISNMAETSGGAVYKAAAGAVASITHSTFRNNVAGGLGAALYLNNDNNGGTGGPGPEINQSLFSGNSTIGGAAGNGNGGAVVLANSATATFRGTTFYNNTAGGTGLGGAIRTAGNSARIDLYNSILFGNSASTTATADISYQGTLNINHSITQVAGTPGVDGVLVGADPLFVSVVDTDPDFLRLSAGSPAVNSGNNDSNTDTEDLAGNTRVQGGRVDMGAYESSYENIAAISSVPGISVPGGTELADLTLPANSTTVTLSNGSTVTLPLEGDPSNWELSDGGTYNPAAGGTYTFLVPVELLSTSDPDWFSNGDDLKATFAVIVQGAPTLEVLWNGQAIPTSGLRLAPNEVGELTVTTSSDAVPEITANLGAPVSLSSTSSPTTVTATAIGNGQITVTLPATANFESMSLTVDVEVDRIVPTVQVRWNGAAIPTSGLQLTLGDPQGVLTVVTNSDAIANIAADALLSLSSSTSPSNVTPVSAGSGQMTITLVQTTRFEALTMTVEVQVNKMAQQIRLYAPQGVLLSAGTASLMEVSSTSGLPVTLSIDDPSIASLSGTDLILHKRGKVSVTATQEGNDEYMPAEPVTVEIYVIGDGDGLRVHPALSPNGDGINEYLRIDGIHNYPDNTLIIFDRSGTVITKIDGYDNDTKIFTGENVHDGTYFYRLNYTTQNGERKHLQGYFEIKR